MCAASSTRKHEAFNNLLMISTLFDMVSVVGTEDTDLFDVSTPARPELEPEKLVKARLNNFYRSICLRRE